MSSNLFFSSNQQRYDRVMQLANNIATIKGLCDQSYTHMDASAKDIDKLGLELMKKHGFKTIDELHDSIMKTLPDDVQKRYLELIKTLKDADTFLANASTVLGVVFAAASGTLLITKTAKALLEVCSDGIFRCEFARGFRLFVRGDVKEGARIMRAVTKQASKYYEIFGDLAEAVGISRAARMLRLFNGVLEVVAKWAFILDIVAVAIQYKVEEKQRDELRKGIHDYFCIRFQVQMQFDDFKATEKLYTEWEGFVTTNSVLINNDAIPEATKHNVLSQLGEKFMTNHDEALKAITNDSVWEELKVYDKLPEPLVAYKDEDPTHADALAWLEEQAKLEADSHKD